MRALNIIGCSRPLCSSQATDEPTRPGPPTHPHPHQPPPASTRLATS